MRWKRSLVVIAAIFAFACGGGVPARIVGMDDEEVAVGDLLELTVRGTVQGDIALDSPMLADAQVVPLVSETATAIFRWIPLASDVGVKTLTFSLHANGQTATESVIVTVQPSEIGRPKFTGTPYNILLDLSQSKIATLPITVKDDDSEEVTMEVVAGTELQNATLTVGPGGKTAMFTFAPTAAQLADRCSFGTQLRVRDPGGLESLAGVFIEARNGCGAEPGILINEILYDPPAGFDPNNDGKQSATDDEFIEMVNVSVKTLELGGATISDSLYVRFTFPFPTTLNPGDAVVVFGGGTPTGFTDPRVKAFAAPGGIGGGLSLTNTGDMVTLRGADNAIIDSVSYPAACIYCPTEPDASVNREVDLNRNTLFLPHDLLEGSTALYSAGKRFDGKPF